MSLEVKKQRKRPLLMAGIGLGLAVVMALMGSIHRNIQVSFDNGGSVRITPASFWGSWLFKAGCNIFYQPKDGIAGTIVLLHNSDSQPAMIIPAADGKTLLCLYYADVCLHLLRIDPTKYAKPFPKGSYLNYIVLTSPWDIESGTTNDWHEVSEYLEAATPDTFNQETVTKLDLGILRFRFGKDDLLPVVEQQIKNMQLYGCNY